MNRENAFRPNDLLPLVRSEGLEPPRFYSLPPQGSASTNSATSAWDTGWSDAARRINGADVTNRGWGDKAVLRLNNYLTSGDFGSICLTSTAIRLRSTSTTPEATGRLLARILTSSASVASSSMMAPRDSRITWWMGMVVVPSTTMRSTLTLSRVATSEPTKGELD